MSVAYVALAAGIIVTVAYLVVIFRGFSKSKAEMAAFGGARLGQVHHVDDRIFKDQERGIDWKAAAGLVLSSVILWLVSVNASVWYAVPFLGLGTSLAVILAFILDKDQ
jgi:cation transporter-like permease